MYEQQPLSEQLDHSYHQLAQNYECVTANQAAKSHISVAFIQFKIDVW